MVVLKVVESAIFTDKDTSLVIMMLLVNRQRNKWLRRKTWK